jgi:hypothetical protein
MRKYIFYVAALTALSITGCRKIEMDGEKEIIIVPGGGGGNTGKRVEMTGRITKDTIFRKGDDNIIKGFLYITKGVTLTVEKGAVVKGAYSGSDVAALIISRGGKLIAEGTQDEPIVFTSSSPNPASGDWGGIVLCGTASINTSFNGKPGLFQVEGGVDNAQGDGLAGSGDAVYATSNDDDNSGTLKFVRIEFAGYAFQPDKEVNSLTLAAVGRGTTIDHVQVMYAKDDAFEWFGGTVNCKYLISYKTQDDDFDTDNGFNGSVQFGLIVRDSLIADISKSESFESDNNSSGGDVVPQTKAVFSNITSIGPRATLTNIGNSNYLAGAQIRRNSSLSIFNSAFLGWPIGILVDASLGRPTDNNITDSTLRLRGILIAGCNTAVKYSVSASSPTGATDATVATWFNNPHFKNKIMTTIDDARYTRPFDYNSPDFQPFGNSPVVIPAASNTYFDDPVLVARTFIKKVDFIGAIGPSGADANWHKGWTRFSSN